MPDTFYGCHEDTTNSELNSILMGNTLQMREAVRTHHPSLPVSPMYKSSGQLGRQPIDMVYLTPDLPIKAGTWMSADRCPGNHRFCIIEIQWKALVGKDLFKLAHPQAR